MGKHVDGLAVDELVLAIFAEHLSVARQRGGVAADVDDDGRRNFLEHLDGLGVHAGAGWIGDDDVGVAEGAHVQFDFVDVLEVEPDKFAVFDVVALGVSRASRTELSTSSTPSTFWQWPEAKRVMEPVPQKRS